MSATIAAQAGLSLWSYRKPILLLAGVVMATPLVLGGMVAAVFAPLAGSLLVDPLPGARLTQPFGCSTLDIEPWSDTCATHHVHTGIDLGALSGTPVRAATSGIVAVGHDPTGYGLYIVVRSDDQLSTLYGHLSVALVGPGEQVAAGEVIGQSGSTGNSQGPHLHFEVRVAGQPVDPLPMLARASATGGDATPPH